MILRSSKNTLTSLCAQVLQRYESAPRFFHLDQHQPGNLIVDEALSVGDRAFRDKCTKKVKEIMQGDITLLFVTHSPEIAKAFCTRGVVMKNGKIVFDGTIDEAIDYYATKY